MRSNGGFEQFFNLHEDGGPAAAGNGFLVALVAVGHGAVVALGNGEQRLIALWSQVVGDREVIGREIGDSRVVGIDGRIGQEPAGFDGNDGTLDGDHLNPIEMSFPDKGAAGPPVGEGFTAKHIFSGHFRIGEGVPDPVGRSLNGDGACDAKWLVHTICFLLCTIVDRFYGDGLHFTDFF